MPVVPRDKGFQATIHHKGRRWRRQFDTHELAERWEAQGRADVLSGREPVIVEYSNGEDPVYGKAAVISAPVLLKDLIEYTAKHEWADVKSGKQLHQNALLMGNVLGMDTDIRSIDHIKIDSLVLSLKGIGNSGATINRKLAALSKVLTTAEYLGVIAKKPRIKKMREAENRIRWYTDEELAGVEDYLIETGEPGMAQFIRFLADTGLRLGEALALEWDDVMLQPPPPREWASIGDGPSDRVLVTKSKSGSPRSVPLTSKATAAIESMSDQKEGPWCWCSKAYLRKQWAAVRAHMGWDEDSQAVLHTLRHTFISRLVQKGIPILTVKELAGHKTIEMTLRYAHLAPHNLTDAIVVLDT